MYANRENIVFFIILIILSFSHLVFILFFVLFCFVLFVCLFFVFFFFLFFFFLVGIYLFVSFFCFSFWVCISEDIDKCIRQREIDTENDLTKRPFHARLYQKNAKWISVKNLLSLKEYRFKWENYYHHNYYSFESSSHQKELMVFYWSPEW